MKEDGVIIEVTDRKIPQGPFSSAARKLTPNRFTGILVNSKTKQEQNQVLKITFMVHLKFDLRLCKIKSILINTNSNFKTDPVIHTVDVKDVNYESIYYFRKLYHSFI